MSKLSRFTNLTERFNKNYFEKASWEQKQVVCGIDEVGRGCLAGPLVTAAVILPEGKTHRLLKDSKVMTLQERLDAYKWITKNCYYGYGIVNHRVIDSHNIWHATLIAMKKALMHTLATSPRLPQVVLVDAMPLSLFDTGYKEIPVHYFPFGESKSSSIAAASIIAKVKRDMLMGKMDALFPGYNLKEHKGYSTPGHKKILFDTAHSLIHRQTFVKRLNAGAAEDDNEQQTIF